MSRYTGPITKKLRRFKLLPESPTETRGRRKSAYGVRLEEKQKLKFIYGVSEKQFRRYFSQAQKNPTNTGIILLQQLELRLDNVVYRLGFAKTRRAARQLVNHGHVLVDDQRVDIPSYRVNVGQTVTLKPQSLENAFVQEQLKGTKPEEFPNWITRKGPVGMIKSLPGADDLRDDIDLQLIIEYYSR